jgi:hypothetical protein
VALVYPAWSFDPAITIGTSETPCSESIATSGFAAGEDGLMSSSRLHEKTVMVITENINIVIFFITKSLVVVKEGFFR